ncbi:DNA topoisomerase 2-binding protein 1 isoform X2 [Procambarus clarkii]|uniref:DNA topoisomerase 2-binding protein 1 isoform X2 n=1 Tax=Procambarus clarkii TaxID=6728 RepID=UPI001E67015A|nr:DNA topoisomerase 2-binding protein 1-like isoform X2 [Procambarus clarkii]
MEVSVCSQDGSISIYFVLPPGLTEATCSTGLLCAYQACHDNGLSSTWLSTEDCLKLVPTKQDVFICDPFEGKAFEYLISGFKCVVLGPRCILSSIHRKEPIPELPSPIHNTAMKGLVITTTGFEKDVKADLQWLIERMAGIYSNNFHESVTHLVANSVGSKKYCVAVQQEIPVMTGEWVKAVWKSVGKDFQEDILATDQQFLSYACPVFKGLTICVSQMPRKEKAALQKMIEENGGTYSSTLDMADTSVLIIPTPEGNKYTYARNWRIQCLTPDWIYDSVEQGSALHMEGYKVSVRGASTPTNENTGNMPPDISLCSTIMNESEAPKLSHINETLDMETSLAVKKDSVSDDKVNRGLEAIENLDLQEAMKAGIFLDGCKIFLSGFGTTHIEKLRRVLNAGGATRFNQLNESVSHIVLGKSNEEHLNTVLKWTSKPHIVYADWIIESIKLRRPADESPFSYLLDTEKCIISNEADKFGKVPAATFPDNNETYVDEEILNQYLRTTKCDGPKDFSMNETGNMSSLPDSQVSFVAGIFSGKVFTVSGYNEDTTEDIIITIREHGGKMVSFAYQGQVHFSLLDVSGNGTVHSRAEEIITFYFIEDCIEQKELLPVEYFHVPLRLQGDSGCLEGCSIAISTYKGKERIFLVNVAAALGAMFQEVFAKKSNAAKNIMASTHLICPAAEGDKYRAATKWGVPAVTCDWLLVCARSLKKESEAVYNVNSKKYPELDRKALVRGLGGEFSNGTLCRVEETMDMERNDTLVPATPVNKQIKTLREQSLLSPSKIKTPDAESFRKLYPTPGVSKTNRSLSEMPTPDTPYGSTWYPNPSSQIRKGFKRLIDSIPDPAPVKRRVPPGTPIEEYYKRFSVDVKETVQNYKVKEPVWLRKDKNEKLGDENVQNVAADNHGPLTGVVVCTSNKLQGQQKELYQTVADLGGEYRWAYDHTVTHYIFQGRNNDTHKEFRIAREQGKFIVAPDWVWMCHDEKTKIDELLFPHTHNPKMSLSIVSTKTTPSTKKGRPTKKNLFEVDKISDEEGEETGQSNDDGENLESEDQKKAALSKQLEEIEALATNSGSVRRNSGASRSRSINERLKHTPTRPMQIETQPVAAEVPESQNTAITWVDPVEREARLKLQHQLTKDTQDIINDNQQLSSEESENDKENSTADQDVTLLFDAERDVSTVKTANQLPLSKPQYIIVLLGMSEEEKSKYTEMIEELGGTISMDQNFDPLSTHVVTGRPSRSERHLASIASGKWMLRSSFIEDSFEAGCFVEEEPHEWGNPANTCMPALVPESLEFRLASAARRWRIKIHDVSNGGETRGVFQNMRALIHSSRERIGAFTRLIEAGGGTVIRGIPPYKEEKDVTHFFLEMNKTPEKIDLANFAARQIPVLLPIFLNEYLIKYPLPIEAEHCIPEYKQIVADMSCSDLKKLHLFSGEMR